MPEQWKQIATLSGRGGPVQYRLVQGGYKIQWKTISYTLHQEIIQQILDSFFLTEDWYPLGADQKIPMRGGLGEFLHTAFSVSSRYASAIAAVLVDLGYLEFRGKKPVYLRKVSS